MRVAPCVQCVRFRCHQSCLCGARSPTGRFLSQRFPHGVLATEPREGCFPGKWGTGPRPGAPLVVPSPDLLGAGVRAGGREGQGGHSAGASHTEPLEGDCPTVSVTRVSVHASAGRGAGAGRGEQVAEAGGAGTRTPLCPFAPFAVQTRSLSVPGTGCDSERGQRHLQGLAGREGH